MFKKLLGNLPFNPSLIGQVAFYAKRLHQEEKIRRLGVIMVALSIFIQMFAVVSPPEPTLANSNNDMIDGGFHSREEAATHCTGNTDGFQVELAYFGIACEDVAVASTVTLRSNDYDRQLFSMGELYYNKAGQTPVSIDGNTYWLRYLWSWDEGTESIYQALSGTTRYGLKFFILYDCGNLVFIGVPAPPEKCPYNPAILASNPKCFEPCPVSNKQHLPKTSPECFEPCPYNTSIPASSNQCFEPCPVSDKQTVPRLSPECFEPCPYNTSIPANSPSCKPCEEAQTREDKTACLEFKKVASNHTQNISNANGTTAKPGDTIVYTLTTRNRGKDRISQHIIKENVSDVLDYSDITDLNGGKLDSQQQVVWPALDISPNETVTKTITVKVKDPLPQTPVSSSDPGHFDLTMTNFYGNSVEIKLPPSIIKTTEMVTRRLPNTGPGSTIAVSVSLAVIVSYFFARNRLIVKEIDLVRSEYASNGSY